MKNSELFEKLDELLSLPAETEVLEFKEAKSSFDIEKLGRYFSALSNEANLRGRREGWLLFGISDQKQIVGTSFRSDRTHLDRLKTEIANKTTNGVSFIEIYELLKPEGRVVMFQIPAAPRGIPVAYEGHYFGREAESLLPLNIEKLERIRSQQADDDWSAGICEEAALNDLDPTAIRQARLKFANKNPHLADEVTQWDDATFLNKAKLTLQGRITRTAILLLGLPESSHFISPAVAQITWILKDRDGVERSYAHFSCPFLLAVDAVYAKIRNLRYQYIPDGTIIPDEVDQYEPFNIREALNNCIVHQDYTLRGRINVVEREDDCLIFTNLGTFLPGSIEQVIELDAPPEETRNHFLAVAMVNLQLIDTIGSGIRRMFINQRKRFFPMPDYEFADRRVKMKLTGRVLDMDYARVLSRNPNLTLLEIMMLDKLQKGRSLSEDEVLHLRKKGFVEGRKQNLRISHQLAASTGQEVEYSLTVGVDDAFFKQMIIEHLERFGQASRANINQLLFAMMPASFTLKQRKDKVKNLLQELRRIRKIRLDETTKIWQLDLV
jgi:ATP-dependent DNA helicase RecG